MLNRLRNYIKRQSIRIATAQLYKGYRYPFLSVDVQLAAMVPEKRQRYYEEVSQTVFDEFGEMKGFMVTELEGLIRHFYEQCAIQAKDEQELTAYRITLKFIQDFERRLVYLASKSKEKNYADQIKQNPS